MTGPSSMSSTSSGEIPWRARCSTLSSSHSTSTPSIVDIVNTTSPAHHTHCRISGATQSAMAGSAAHHDRSQPVEPGGVVAHDALQLRVGQVAAGAHGGHELRLLGWVVVAVVGADEQVVLADVLHQVRDVLVGLASHEQAIVAEELR